MRRSGQPGQWRQSILWVSALAAMPRFRLARVGSDMISSRGQRVTRPRVREQGGRVKFSTCPRRKRARRNAGGKKRNLRNCSALQLL